MWGGFSEAQTRKSKQLMNPYSLPPLITGILFLLIGGFCFLKNRKSVVNLTFGLLCLATFWWQFSWFILFNTTSEKLAIYIVKFGYTGIIFIPITFFHFFVSFLRAEKDKWLVFISYIIGLVLVLVLWTTNYFVNGFYRYYWGYYPRVGFLHPVHLAQLSFLAIRALILLVSHLKRQRLSPLRYNQIRYVLLALLAYIPAASDYAVNYGVEFYPVGFIFISIFALITAYAIVTYRLMDINVAITKGTIFTVVCTFVLGIPVAVWFWGRTYLYDKIGANWGLVPVGMALILASLGPTIYGFFRQKTEATLFKERQRYQEVLKRSTRALVTMLDLRQLLNYIVNTISETVGVEKISLFLREGSKSRYQMKASYGIDEELVDNYVLKPNEGIISWLKQSKAVFIKEEMERALPGKAFENIYGDLGKIGADFILPLFYKDNLVGVLNLSNKQSGGVYNQTDIDILESLGAEAAVAIENARLHTEVITDELTELYQPKYFELRLREEIEKGKRYRHCLSLMMIEVDNFEEIKSKYGDEKRDKLLKVMAGIIKGNLRVGDIACRCGEKVFGIILPEITEEPRGNIKERLKKQIKETVEIGERLRRRVKEEELNVTVSIGIANFDGEDRDMKRETLIKQTKEALSQAKREGNTVKVFYDEKLRKEISTEVLEWIRETEETLVSGEICVDLVKHTVQVKGKPIKLTPKAFDLLCLLMKKKGRVLNRSFLTESIWGYEYFGTTRTVDSHIKCLRQKLGPEGKKIETVKGVGYKFVDEG